MSSAFGKKIASNFEDIKSKLAAATSAKQKGAIDLSLGRQKSAPPGDPVPRNEAPKPKTRRNLKLPLHNSQSDTDLVELDRRTSSAGRISSTESIRRPSDKKDVLRSASVRDKTATTARQWFDVGPISTVAKALEDNLQFKPVFPKFTEKVAPDELRERWQKSMLEVGFLNVRKDGWGSWKLYKCMLTKWAVHLLPSNSHKPFTSKAHGRINLLQITSIDAPTKNDGWQARTIVIKTMWTSYEICAPSVDQMVVWLCKLREAKASCPDGTRFRRLQSRVGSRKESVVSCERCDINGLDHLHEHLDEDDAMDSDDESQAAVAMVTVGPKAREGANPPVCDRVVAAKVPWRTCVSIQLGSNEVIHVWTDIGVVFRVAVNDRAQVEGVECLSSETYQALQGQAPALDLAIEGRQDQESRGLVGNGHLEPSRKDFWLGAFLLVLFGYAMAPYSSLGTLMLAAGLAVMMLSQTTEYFPPRPPSTLTVRAERLLQKSLGLNPGFQPRRPLALYLAGLRQTEEEVIDDATAFVVGEEDIYANQIAQMTAKFPDTSKTVLCRFLKARQYNVEAASTMLSNYYTWRKEQGELTVAAILPEIQMGVFHFHGRALDNTPLVVIDCCRFITKNTSTEQMTKLAVVMTELVAHEFPEVQKITALVDLKNLSLRTNVDLAMFQELIRIVNAYVPEVLGRLFVVNSPVFIKGLWNFIRGLLDEATVDKIRFLSSQKDLEILREFISPENLPVKYGGSSTYPYDPADVVNATAQDPKWGAWYDMARQQPGPIDDVPDTPSSQSLPEHSVQG